MNSAPDPALLSGPARKVLAPDAPVPLRAMAARGVLPGLKPQDMVSVIATLRGDADPAVSASAKATFDALPAPILNGALVGPLDPFVIDALARSYLGRGDVLEKLVMLQNVDPETSMYVAANGDEAATELIAVNEERLLAHPPIIEKLYMNPRARMSTAERLIELAVRNGLELKGLPAFEEAVEAIADELIAEGTDGPTEGDLLFFEVHEIGKDITLDAPDGDDDLEEVDPTADPDAAMKEKRRLEREAKKQRDEELKLLPLALRLEKMTKSEKVRTASIGGAGERALLVKDGNRSVAHAVLKNPNIQENEITRICHSREIAGDILQSIAMRGMWTRSHEVKLLLVMNPKTPLATAARFIAHLRPNELKAIAKSRTVPGAIAQAARNQIARKEKK